MPMYEYACTKCGERFEIIQKFSDAPIRRHSEKDARNCDGAVKKLLSAPAIRFKGSGWYVTDYGKGGKKPPTGAEKDAQAAKPDASSKTASAGAAQPAAAGNDNGGAASAA